MAASTSPRAGRTLSVPAWLGLVVVYLILLQVLNLLFGPEGYAKFKTVDDVVGGMLIPIGSSAVFVAAIVTYLGWWPQVLRDDTRGPRWLLSIPVLMILAILVGANYGELSDRTVTFLLLLLLGGMCIGFGEEIMYRGIGLNVFRSNGFTEAKVALWTCVVFGLSHSTNIFTEGTAAILQVLVTVAAGFFFYLIRRATGSIIPAIVIHGLWDLALFSGSLGEEQYVGTLAFILMDIILVVFLLIRRKHLGFTPAPAT